MRAASRDGGHGGGAHLEELGDEEDALGSDTCYWSECPQSSYNFHKATTFRRFSGKMFDDCLGTADASQGV